MTPYIENLLHGKREIWAKMWEVHYLRVSIIDPIAWNNISLLSIDHIFSISIQRMNELVQVKCILIYGRDNV